MLIHDFVFMANVIQPKVCIIENVPGIKRSEVFQHACARLRHWVVISSISTSSRPLPLAFHNDASGFLRCLYGEISRKGPDLEMTKT